MADRIEYDENDPRHYAVQLKELLEELAQRARAEAVNIEEPTGHALFRATADVCSALARTCEHYERQPRLVRSSVER